MKKAFIISALVTVFVACNNSASTEATVADSTVKVDSIAAGTETVTVDTVAQEVK